MFKITIIPLGNEKTTGFLHAPVCFTNRNFIDLALSRWCIIVMNMSTLIFKFM